MPRITSQRIEFQYGRLELNFEFCFNNILIGGHLGPTMQLLNAVFNFLIDYLTSQFYKKKVDPYLVLIIEEKKTSFGCILLHKQKNKTSKKFVSKKLYIVCLIFALKTTFLV